MRAKLSLEAEILQVLLDVLLRQRPRDQTRLGRLLGIALRNELTEPEVLQLVARQPRGHRRVHPLPSHLVLVRLLRLAPTHEVLHHPLHAVHRDRCVHLLLLLIRYLHVHLLQILLVLTGGIAPLDVLVGRFVQVRLHVVEGVLCEVGDAHHGVAPHGACRRLRLAREHLNEGRLAGAVAPNAGDTGREGALHCDVGKRGLVCLGVSVIHLSHLEQSLALVVDALQEAGLGEGKLERGGIELVVRLGLGALLDKLRQVALILLQLPGLIVENVGADVVQEARVVGDDHAGTAGEGGEVVLEPLHVGGVQMVGGLIQQQNVRSDHHRASERQLHLPPTRQTGDRLVQKLVIKANRAQNLLRLLRVHPLQLRLLQRVLQHAKILLLRVNVVLHVDRLQLRGRGEALELVIGNGAHEGRLAAAVVPAQAVPLPALHVQPRIVQQNLATVRQRKLAVAQILALLIVLHHNLLLRLLEGALLELDSHGLVLRITHKSGKVGLNQLHPRVLLEDAHVDELARHSDHKREGWLVHLLSTRLGRDNLLQAVHHSV
mmetsp:Transcript_12146/g.21868  ORF Transcript_12146/g.21868 Transcript_12146/m.21868 type:complete len:547 (-) Transcript_12146:594-2234(-)